MKKLKLQLDEVRVDSFDTSALRGPKGTVVAHITAGVSCYDSDCCTPNYGCVDSNYTGPCECDPYQYSGAQYPTCEYSCIYNRCN